MLAWTKNFLVENRIEDSIAVLYGAVSWGGKCADEGNPGIYANIFNLRGWIEQTMETTLTGTSRTRG